jgi:hypothetical protein
MKNFMKIKYLNQCRKGKLTLLLTRLLILFESQQQSLINVFHYISNIFDSNGEPNQIISDAYFSSLFDREILM